MAIAGFIVGQKKPTDKGSRSTAKRRLCTDATVAIQQLEPDAIFTEHG